MKPVNTKVDKIPTKLDGYDSRISIVDSKLGVYVKAVRKEKNLSVDDVAANSKRGGKKGISAAYVNKIENNPEVNPTTPMLEALADGLGVTHAEIFAHVRSTKPDSETILDEQFANLGLKFSGLSATKKEKAKALIELMDRELERLANEQQ